MSSAAMMMLAKLMKIRIAIRLAEGSLPIDRAERDDTHSNSTAQASGIIHHETGESFARRGSCGIFCKAKVPSKKPRIKSRTLL